MYKISTIYILLLSLILASFLYIANSLPIFQWDESRLGVNAIEMLKSHDYIVTTFLGEPDNWNTKPPLVIWLMCLSLKLFGYSELSLRIPAILFSILTLFYIVYIVKKEKIVNNLFSIILLIILASSIGFSGYHIAITADYDSILVFFFTVFNISTFYFNYYLDKDIDRSKSYGYIALIAFTFGFFTKGIVICLALPSLIFYFIISKKIKYLFNKNNLPLYIVLFISLCSILGYYLLRNYYSPDYIKSVFMNELGGRFSESNENHLEPISFYIVNILSGRFSIWVYIIFLSPIIYIRKYYSNEKLKTITTFNLIVISSFLLIISIAKTKLHWYDAPIYPLLSIQIIINIYVLYEYLQKGKNLILASIFFISIVSIFNITNYYNKLLALDSWPVENNSALLKYYIKKNNPKDVNIIAYGYQSHLDFYRLLLSENGINLTRNTYDNLPEKSDLIYLTSEYGAINKIKTYYDHSIIDSNINGYIFKINGINEENINRYIELNKQNILSNKEWMADIAIKAKFNNITIDQQIINDIIYVSEMNDKVINTTIKQSILNK